MRGRERIRKKHMKQAGWQILREGPVGEGRKGFRLVLRRPDGTEVTVEAPTRPRACARWEALLH